MIIIVEKKYEVKNEDAFKGRAWLKDEAPNYWEQRGTIMILREFIMSLEQITNMPHWEESAQYARFLKENIEHDGV